MLEQGSLWKGDGTLLAIIIEADKDHITVYETGQADCGLGGIYQGQGIFTYGFLSFMDVYRPAA